MLNGIWQGVFAHLSEWLLGIILAVLTAAGLGCTTTTTNNGKWTIGWGTYLSIETEAKKTTGEQDPAKVNMEFPSLEEWILDTGDGEMGPPEPEPTPAPEPAEPAPTD